MTVAIGSRELSIALGEAVGRIWSRLPKDLQHDLFEEALASRSPALRQQLAVFLHGKHSRTAEPAAVRALLEPDSLGG